MLKLRPWLMVSLVVWLVLSMLLAGCATPTQQDVGAVVVAPQAKLQPVPEVVQQTLPKPAGYFQQTLVNYFSGSPKKLTTSTTPTSAVGQTH